MKTLLCLAAVLLAYPLHAAENQPAWSELESLLGMDKESPVMQKFVGQYALKKAAKGDSGSFTPANQSYSIQFNGNLIECIILHVGPGPKDYGETHWVGYNGDLPFGLKRLYARKDVVGLLGDPDTPAGNFWQVQGSELRITFSGSTGLLQEIYIWKKPKTPAKKKN